MKYNNKIIHNHGINKGINQETIFVKSSELGLEFWVRIILSIYSWSTFVHEITSLNSHVSTEESQLYSSGIVILINGADWCSISLINKVDIQDNSSQVITFEGHNQFVTQ